MATRTLPKPKALRQNPTRSAEPILNISGRWWVPMAALGLGLFILRALYLIFITPYGLAPDEAQYWSWLANPDFSYLTKPPLTTWAMGISTWVLGDTLLGVKFFALASQSLVPVLGAAIARQLVAEPLQNKAGWWAFGLFTTLPLIAAGGLIMAPDVLLLPLWMAALLMALRAFNAPAPRALCWGRWLLMGACVGLAGLAKYNAAMFFPLLAIAALLWRRDWFKAPQPYGAAALALLMQAPVLYWNATHQWAGVKHVLWQAEGDGRHGGLATLADFIGSQALVLGPLGLVLMIMAWVYFTKQGRRVTPAAGVVVLFTLPIFAGFMLQTFGAKVQANWPLLATAPAMVLAGALIAQANLTPWKMRLVMAGLVLNSLLSLALYNTQLLRPLLPLKTDPTKDLLGWADMGTLLGGALQRLDNPIVLGVRYQTLAPLAFHTKPAVTWMYWNAEGRRTTDYDDWLWPQSLPTRPVVLVKESPEFPIHVAELFRECRPWHNLGVEQHGEVTRHLYTWLCWNYRTQSPQ